ncbi:MAG: hypothetical protein M1358_24290 [Chloroflexi bacterium]|nr:hypothetical protein [Chloroflexota bacterium]
MPWEMCARNAFHTRTDSKSQSKWGLKFQRGLSMIEMTTIYVGGRGGVSGHDQVVESPGQGRQAQLWDDVSR